MDPRETNSIGLLRTSRLSGHTARSLDATLPTNLGGSSVHGIKRGGAINSI